MKKYLSKLALLTLISFPCIHLQAATLGYADTILEYFNSGTGTMSTPYGGTFPGGPGFPMSVSLDVVLGDDPGPTGFTDFLSLPMGSFVTVGFTDETIIDGIGNDLFITETGSNGERADIFVSSNSIDFTFIGTADGAVTTAFDLQSIGFTEAVTAVKILGLDNLGGSPGFDLVNVRVLPGSIGAAPVPIPAAIWLFASGLLGLFGFRNKK